MDYCAYRYTSFLASIGKHGLEIEIVAKIEKQYKIGFEMDGIFVNSAKGIISIFELKYLDTLIKGGSAEGLFTNLSKGAKNGVRSSH